MPMTFEWDEQKAISNARKHGVTFEEAKTVFNDPLSVTISDPSHSFGEGRYVDIGTSLKGRLLVVWYTERRHRTRLIGCRRATQLERRAYEEGEHESR